jgi:hypothetical protein
MIFVIVKMFKKQSFKCLLPDSDCDCSKDEAMEELFIEQLALASNV